MCFGVSRIGKWVETAALGVFNCTFHICLDYIRNRICKESCLGVVTIEVL